MNRPATSPRFATSANRVILSYLFAAVTICQITASPADPRVPAKVVQINRAVPNVEPPKTTLEFSASPTIQEIFRARVFEEPLVPIGGEPRAAENSALAAALLGYAKRSGPDDFSSLTTFLEKFPKSPWRAALLTDLGLDYYNTAHYSLALEAWREAWALGQKATDAKGKFLADRAVCELAGLYSRLGRMDELEALLKSVEKRVFIGGATERINIAREVLANMQQRPEVCFRCGPMALHSIQRSLNPEAPMPMEVFNSASTQKGFSLPQVAELSKKVGLNYQMAFRRSGVRLSSGAADSAGDRRRATSEPSARADDAAPGDGRTPLKVRGEFIVPSVVHWKVGHYAAIVRQEGDRYLVEDPTFINSVWATKQALEDETSGYFLIPPGDLPRGWRSVDAKEGAAIRGKGFADNNDPNIYALNDLQTGGTCPATGMAASSVHLMLANLQIRDTPVGYTPPVGPPVRFTVRYNQRDYLQPASASSKLLGPKWTHDWNEALVANSATATYFVGGGGARIFTGFDTNTQSYAPNQYDQTLLKRTSTNTYEMVWPDGSKKIFGPYLGALGLALTQVMDPSGNAVTLTYDQDVRLVALTDAIGQVTTVSYQHPTNPNLITKITDPFGRFATFEYADLGIPWNFSSNTQDESEGTNHFHFDMLTNITDVLGLESQFAYKKVVELHREDDFGVFPNLTNNHPGYVDTILRMTTPYGTTSFITSGPTSTNTTRVAQTTFPDGSQERVEFNQSSNLGPPDSEPAATVPTGMAAPNGNLYVRNTYYWSRTAYASSGGNYAKAKIYHWLHGPFAGPTSGILESTKEPLENRVWYNYAGQSQGAVIVGASDRPTHIGRVLDDGQTQLHIQAYNQFGRLTNSVDPLGRTLSFVYATNGIDLLEVRQTRAVNNELLFRATYNAQHRPLTVVDAAGQTNTYTYNARGQPLTATDAKGETTTYTYDADGHLFAVDGPLPGTNDTMTAQFDVFSRLRTLTSVSGYRVAFDYDVMDRVTRITHPDSTFEQITYDRLDMVTFRDRAGRQTFFEHDNVGQVKKRTDPLGRVTRFDWCRCGQIKSLTDPMGRTTSWLTDLQGRPTGKRYADGSQVTYQYENASSRLRLAIDEKQQVTQFAYNRDDTLKSIGYGSATIPTPGVSFQYDPDYGRVVSMTDGTGTTRHSYNPITGTPTLGAGALASVDGPLPNDTITYSYDELGRPVHRAINGVDSAMTFDAGGRLIGVTNALGAFAYAYDGSSGRLVSKSFPNGQNTERRYGNTLQDLTLQRITHTVGATPVSEFLYGRDVTRGRITTWSQQAGAQSPNLLTFGYDAVNQLLSATVTNAGNLVNTFAYSYDPTANRLTEQVGASNYTATYNGLNEIRTTTVPGTTRTNEWDAKERLVAVTVGNQRTEFTYDGLSRRVGIRQLLNGSEVSRRRFVWCGGRICEERDAAGVVTKRFFRQGMKVESGPNAGNYFYTRDHLGSIRELTDSSGTVRARYAYDPYGRRTKLTGDMEADFGFAGMLWSAEANLNFTHFRAYDPALGRWLSRDPLRQAEMQQGPNLYAYVGNEPVNRIDPEGLISIHEDLAALCVENPIACKELLKATGGAGVGGAAVKLVQTAQGWAPAANATLQCAQAAAPELPALVETGLPALETALPALETALPALEAELPAAEAGTFEVTELLGEGGWVVETEIVESGHSLYYQWWMATNRALQPWMGSLSSFEEMGAAMRMITKAQEIIFGGF